jgi:hypothetical protein
VDSVSPDPKKLTIGKGVCLEGRQLVTLKLQYPPMKLHDVTFQKTIILTVSAVRTKISRGPREGKVILVQAVEALGVVRG